MSQDIWDQFYTNGNFEKAFWVNDDFDTGARWCLKLEEKAHLGFVDLGCGVSNLGQAVVDAHFDHATLIDISAVAIRKQEEAIEEQSSKKFIDCVVIDALKWEPERGYGVAHDRGLFQWLKDKDERIQYKKLLKDILVEDGRFILTQFSPRKAKNGEPDMSTEDPMDTVEFLDDVFRLMSMSRKLERGEDSEKEYSYHYHFARRPNP